MSADYGVDPSEFYDPEPKVHRLFSAPIEDITPEVPPINRAASPHWQSVVPERPIPEPPPVPGPKPKDHYLAAINVALDILSYRLVILIAVLAEAAMFGYAVVNPDLTRLYVVGAFAVLVGLPLLYFYRNPK